MSASAQKGLSIVLGIAVAMAIAAVVLLQILGKTTIGDDYNQPPVASPKR